MKEVYEALKERKWVASGLLFLKYMSDSFTWHKRPSTFGPKPVYIACLLPSFILPTPNFWWFPSSLCCTLYALSPSSGMPLTPYLVNSIHHLRVSSVRCTGIAEKGSCHICSMRKRMSGIRVEWPMPVFLKGDRESFVFFVVFPSL